MVEVIVSLIVLEVGVLAAAGLIVLSLDLLQQAQREEWAVSQTSRIADSLAHCGITESGAWRDSLGEVTWERSGSGSPSLARILVRGPAPSHKVVLDTYLVVPPPPEHPRLP